jgi:putative FmdB family regulatory protein
MPLHGYKCQECEMEYEVFYTSQKAVEKEEPEEKCPKCDSTEKERLPPKGTSFDLKGRGWYKDGYG